MALASAIFWVVIGVLYIAYMAFKEHPKETLIVIGVMVVIAVCVAAFYAIFAPLEGVSPELAWVFKMGIIGAGLYFLIQKKIADDKKAKQQYEQIVNQAKRDVALHKVAEHLNESSQEESQS